MEENLIQTETSIMEDSTVPTDVDNATESEVTEVSKQNPAEDVKEVSSIQQVGQSKKDPASELILGKFKSVDDLSKAYEALQKHQGLCSEELGQLRKTASGFQDLQNSIAKFNDRVHKGVSYINEVREKYNSPEYFQDSNFEKIFNEAFLAFGYDNLDIDKFVGLLDGYVSSRISAHDKKNSATKETQQILESMGYSKNPKNSLTPPKKRLDEMTPQEIDDMLDRLI